MQSVGRSIPGLLLTLHLLAGWVTAEDWPQWRGPLRDGVWREDGIVDCFDAKGIPVLWRTPIAGGYAGPAVAEGRVYVTDRRRDKNTERLLCLDEKTGKVLWTHEYTCRYRGVDYDAGPRCTPTVAHGRVYSVGTMGHLFCLDARSGTVIWQKNYEKDFGTAIPVWGIASAPLVDADRLIVLAGGAKAGTILALNRESGAEIWRALSEKEMGYSPPVLLKAGGASQLIVWVPEAVVSLSPEDGKTWWRHPFHSHIGLTVATPVFQGDRLLVSSFYNGTLMLRLAPDRPAASELWRGKSESEIETDGVHCLMSTPLLLGDYLYGIDSYGALRCLDAKTGKRVWETYRATGRDRWWNAFLIPNGDRVFIPNEQGELIIARLSAAGYEEISRARLIEPTNQIRRRDIVWSYPAFANRCVYARNDREILCANLAAAPSEPTGR
jgi:outer membrane protein assembly factor BamB